MNQRKVEKAAVNAAAGLVGPSPTASMSAAAAASAPRLPPMVPLPPYPACYATAPAYPAQFYPSVPPIQTAPRVQTWRHQPPAWQFATFGVPAVPACPRAEELLVDLSPPPGNSTDSQTRDYGARLDVIGVQNVARGQAYPVYDANLDMQVPDEFGLCHPPLVDLHPVEAYHRARKIRTVWQESPMPASRPGPIRVIPSVDDLNPLPPSAGLHGFASRHQDLMGAKEQEFRRITFLQSQLKQASINVNRLKSDLQFLIDMCWQPNRIEWTATSHKVLATSTAKTSPTFPSQTGTTKSPC